VLASGSGFPRNQDVNITAFACANAGRNCIPAAGVNAANPWIVQSGTGAFTSERKIPCADLTQVVAVENGLPIYATEVKLEAEDWDVRKNLPASRPRFNRVSSISVAHVCPQS
jgi:hypothetical protein